MKIFLIGFMGSGKSYLGRQLARLLHVGFTDLDEQIENSTGKTILALFDEKGASFFRELEQQHLHLTRQTEDAVIATGGGTPCFYDNIEWMNQHGLTIYLDASPELLVRRLQNETAKRPLIKDLEPAQLSEYIQTKLQERAVYYQQARIIFQLPESRNPDPQEVLRQIGLQLKFDKPDFTF